MNFFGIASLSGTIMLKSNGDFDVSLNGGMTIGSSDFGLRGDFSIRVFSLHYDDVHYRFGLSGSASVKVRAFGVTLAGVGIGFDFGVDTANADSHGRVKIELKVHVVGRPVAVLDRRRRLLHDRLPAAAARRRTSAATAPGTFQIWSDGVDHVLYLNVGDLDHRNARNIGQDDVNEAVVIEQIGGTATDATIKVSAYGRSNIYNHVTQVVGDFGDGNDNVVIRDSVKVPVVISGGAGNDVITQRRHQHLRQPRQPDRLHPAVRRRRRASTPPSRA